MKASTTSPSTTSRSTAAPTVNGAATLGPPSVRTPLPTRQRRSGYAALGVLLIAGLGALVPNLREANQATILVIFPLIIPMMFSSSVSAAPNSPLFLTLSMIPFTSPVTMISRLAGRADSGPFRTCVIKYY